MPTAVAIRQIDGKPGQVYYPLTHVTLPTLSPGPDEVLVRLRAAALNHRDLFVRQHLYPGTAFGVPLCADGCGVVEAAGRSPAAQTWLGKRVVLNPGAGWASDPDGPEGAYTIMGGTKLNPAGTLAEVVVARAAELEEAPAHLSDVEAAAVPLAGLTAWRAVFSKTGSHASAGCNVLITGIGGGVALAALGFAVAAGCRVYVTSGSAEKLAKAREMGAAGGVSYKESGWEKTLLGMLPEERSTFDAIIDGAGGDVGDKAAKLLKLGGVVVSYGMTLGPKVSFPMAAVLKNIELRGSTMGSRREFADMVRFVREKQVRPVVSRAVRGIEDLEVLDSLFEDMKKGSQFGKLVVQMKDESGSSRL